MKRSDEEWLMYDSPGRDALACSVAEGGSLGRSDLASSHADQAPTDTERSIAIPYAARNMKDSELALVQAGRVLQSIRAVREVFPVMRDLADHPGWEIMLNLYIASGQGRSLSVADICDLTGTWRPLAIRYLEMMVERGLINREGDQEPDDKQLLSLTPTTDLKMQELLCGFARGFSDDLSLKLTN